MTDIAMLKNTTKQETIEDIIHKYFSDAYTEINLLHELLKAFNQKNPVIMHVGRYDILINSQLKFVASVHLEKTLDYFSLAKYHQGTAEVFQYQTLDDAAYQECKQRMFAQDAKQISLQSFAWQIYHEILPQDIHVVDHLLMLKIRYMPNFAVFNDIPLYVEPILASCLSTPKTVLQLQERFANVDSITIQRLFLLSILSGIADMSVLEFAYTSDDVEDNNLTTQSTTVNKTTDDDTKKTTELQRASNTGFFSRLLKKLAW